MDLSKDELEQLLAQQADRVAKESDKRTKKYMGDLTKESDERMKVYIGGLKEDFDSKLDTVLELVEEIPNIKAKQDIMFDKIGEIAEDVTILKETVKDHAVRIQRLEAR